MLLAGSGGAVAIGLLSFIAYHTGQPLVMAPFGASCVLLFYVPNSPLSQPVNVVGGHLLATFVGLLLRQYLPDTWWGAAFAVGLAISLMGAFRVTHPPAGADPIVVFATHPGFDFIIVPVLIGSVALVVIASLFHVGSGTTYPLRKGA
ncbi:MAG: HPP family protein [Methylocella sp.]